MTAAALLLGLSAFPSHASAGFDHCGITSFENAVPDANGASGIPRYLVTGGTPATLTVSCDGASVPPTLRPLNPSGLRVGSANASGSGWSFVIRAANDGSRGGNIVYTVRLTEPGGAIQDIEVAAAPGASEGGPCDDLEEGVIRAKLEARPPGATAFAPVSDEKLCALLKRVQSPATGGELDGRTLDMVTVDVLPPVSSPAWPNSRAVPPSEWPFDLETVFRITGEVPGFQPFAGWGTLRAPTLWLEGNRFTIEAKAAKARDFIRPPGAGPGSSFCDQSFEEVSLGLAVTGDWVGEAYLGTIIGDNGYVGSQPKLDADGALRFDIVGCGDGDPVSLDGFYDTQLGKGILDAGGITQPALAVADDGAIGAIFKVTNNQKAVTASFSKLTHASGEIVVLMHYETSFSAHSITVRSNKKAAAFARKCGRSRGARLRARKLAVKRGRKRNKATFLTCTPRKGRPSRLMIDR